MSVPSQPSISVVVPSLDQGLYLDTALSSIFDQRYAHLEVLVIDGGSTDHSVSIIESFAPRLAYWRSRSDGGQAHALLEGFQRSSGEILCWVNSDDLLLPGSLETIASVFSQEPEVDVVVGKARFIGPGGDEVGRYPVEERTTDDMLHFWKGWPIAQPATFFRRRAYDQVSGLRADLNYGLDLDLFLRMSTQCSFRWIDADLASYRLHSQSKTSDWRANRSKFWQEAAKVTRPFWPPKTRIGHWQLRFMSALHLRLAQFDHWRLRAAARSDAQ